MNPHIPPTKFEFNNQKEVLRESLVNLMDLLASNRSAIDYKGVNAKKNNLERGQYYSIEPRWYNGGFTIRLSLDFNTPHLSRDEINHLHLAVFNEISHKVNTFDGGYKYNHSAKPNGGGVKDYRFHFTGTGFDLKYYTKGDKVALNKKNYDSSSPLADWNKDFYLDLVMYDIKEFLNLVYPEQKLEFQGVKNPHSSISVLKHDFLNKLSSAIEINKGRTLSKDSSSGPKKNNTPKLK